MDSSAHDVTATGSGASGNANDGAHGNRLSAAEDASTRPPVKRARVTLACLRCKTRKQKCDGVHPSCGSCSRLDVECKYIVPLVPRPGEKKLYIKALEDRVAELESLLSSSGHNNVGEDHWGQKQPQPARPAGYQPPPSLSPPAPKDDIDELLSAVRDLSLSASGYYIGGTATITIGRVLSSMIQTQRGRAGLHRGDPSSDDPNPKSISSDTLAEMMGPFFVTQNVANRLLQGYLKHLSTRFPVLHTPWLLGVHDRRDEHLDIYEESVLHLVYACGGRFLETTGETGNYFCDQHYDVAVTKMEEILCLRDDRSVTYLLLLAIYCLRAPRNPGSWVYSGLAMRACIDIGLHRRHHARGHSLQGELKKRLFWACYYLEREVSIALGRPPAISDNDIDLQLPLDIDENVQDEEIVLEAAQNISPHPRSPPTTMTSFIHHCRLKQIESEVQHTIYRVDKPASSSYEVIQEFLDRLISWKEHLPVECYTVQDNDIQPFEGIVVYMVPYNKTVRLLLYPQLSNTPINMHYLQVCAEACGGVCTSYKQLHHSMDAGYSPLSLQSVFLAGLTLIYCAWLAPAGFINATGPLTDCSIMLYVMTERFPSARKYRDVFERIKTSVTDLIEQGKHQPRKAVEVLGDKDMRDRFMGLDQNLTGGGRDDFTHMISQMTGENVGFWSGGGGMGMGGGSGGAAGFQSSMSGVTEMRMPMESETENVLAMDNINGTNGGAAGIANINADGGGTSNGNMEDQFADIGGFEDMSTAWSMASPDMSIQQQDIYNGGWGAVGRM